VTWTLACAHREAAGRSFEFCAVDAQEFIGTLPRALQQSFDSYETAIESILTLA